MRLVQLFGQLHAAHALVVALDGGGLLAFALGGGFFVELAGAQLGEQAQLLDGALEVKGPASSSWRRISDLAASSCYQVVAAVTSPTGPAAKT